MIFSSIRTYIQYVLLYSQDPYIVIFTQIFNVHITFIKFSYSLWHVNHNTTYTVIKVLYCILVLNLVYNSTTSIIQTNQLNSIVIVHLLIVIAQRFIITVISLYNHHFWLNQLNDYREVWLYIILIYMYIQ
jgi:hypothetical protein